MPEKFDENNFDHNMFHGSQEGLDKANARKEMQRMEKDKEINSIQLINAIKDIDKGISPIVLSEHFTKLGEKIRVLFGWKA